MKRADIRRDRFKAFGPASPRAFGPASHRRPLAHRLAGTGAALLLGALGGALPGASTAMAETAATPILVPATIQSSALEAAIAPAGVVETPASDTPEADAPLATRIGTGVASWYGKQFAGRRTASGETFDPSELTAAHRTLPFGSKVLVTNPRNGQSVVVRINDRGPFKHSRVIDVSRAAAVELGLIGPGSGQVTLDLIEE